MIPILQLTFDPLFANLEVVLMLMVFVWLFSWAKGNLGSAALAVLFSDPAVSYSAFGFQ